MNECHSEAPQMRAEITTGSSSVYCNINNKHQQHSLTRGHGLLSRIQVDKSKHFAAVVHLGTHLLKLPTQDHVPVQLLRHLRTHGGLAGGICRGTLGGCRYCSRNYRSPSCTGLHDGRPRRVLPSPKRARRGAGRLGHWAWQAARFGADHDR